MRISGVNIPDDKRLDVALSYIYGVGRRNTVGILERAKIDGSKRVKTLTEEEQKQIQQALETLKLEGDLKNEVNGNVRRLKDIGAYRGVRHSRNLPSRGQRTKSNARTKRGKRVTIGAIKKEDATKMGIV